MSRIGWYTAIVLATLSGVLLLWQYRMAIVLFFLSLAVAAAIRPILELLSQRGLPRNVALLSSYALVIIGLAFLLLEVSKPLIYDIQQGLDSLSTGYEQVKNFWLNSNDQLLRGVAEGLPPTAAVYNALLGEQSNQLIQAVFGMAEGAALTVEKLSIIIILSIYWGIDQVHFERLWLSLLPLDQRSRARQIWRKIEEGVGKYLLGRLLQGALAGVLLWIGYWALGLKYITLLAILGALARLIPWLGATFDVILVFLLGSTVGIWNGIGAAVYTALILFSMGIFVEPRLFSRQRYSPLLVATTVIALANSFGLIGAILGPALAVAIQILVSDLFYSNTYETSGLPANEIASVKARLFSIRAQMASLQNEDPMLQGTANLVDRLDGLVDKTQAHLQTNEDQPTEPLV